MNQPQTVAYVVQLLAFTPSEQELQKVFEEDDPFYQIRILAQEDQVRIDQAWKEEMMKAAGFKWQVKPSERLVVPKTSRAIAPAVIMKLLEGSPFPRRPAPVLARDAVMPIAMKLSRIIISEINDQQVIYLKEVEGERTFPILIGIFEATSIDRRVKGFASPRPLTHDLIVNVVENLGAEFQDVVISELKEHTYFAKLRIRHGANWSRSTPARRTPSPWR